MSVFLIKYIKFYNHRLIKLIIFNAIITIYCIRLQLFFQKLRCYKTEGWNVSCDEEDFNVGNMRSTRIRANLYKGMKNSYGFGHQLFALRRLRPSPVIWV